MQRLNLIRTLVGKYDGEWTQLAIHRPQEEREITTSDHQFMIYAEWDRLPDVDYYIFHPKEHPGTDLQHTVGSTQCAFLFPQPREFFIPEREYQISGYRITQVPGNFLGGRREKVCETEPFTLSCELPITTVDCAICLTDEVIDQPVIHHSLPVASFYPSTTWNLETNKEKLRAYVESYYTQAAAILTARETRNKILDYCDVLLCGHAFHKDCLDRYRETKESGFDVPCPICRFTIPVDKLQRSY